MLAMWHRCVTRKFLKDPRFQIDNEEVVRIAQTVLLADVRIVADEVANQCEVEFDGKSSKALLKSLKECMPLSKRAWVEFRIEEDDGQVGVIFNEKAERVYQVAVIGNINGDPMIWCDGIVRFSADGYAESAELSNRCRCLIDRENKAMPRPFTGILIGLKAFAFAHCKNVDMIDADEHGPGAKWCRRQHAPDVVYKRLRIPGTVRRRTATGEHSGVELRSHICRGHFKTYTAEAPLFGKYVGKFWHPCHVRGNPKIGEVEKDYVLVPDKPGKDGKSGFEAAAERN